MEHNVNFVWDYAETGNDVRSIRYFYYDIYYQRKQ